MINSKATFTRDTKKSINAFFLWHQDIFRRFDFGVNVIDRILFVGILDLAVIIDLI
jgi:hypothetical protein